MKCLNHSKPGVSSQIYLQPKADCQRRKGLRTKSRKAISIIEVEMHYAGALGFPRLLSKNPCRSSLFCLGEDKCLKASSTPASKTVIHRNSSLAEQAASWGVQRGKKVIVTHLAMGIMLLTPDFRRYVRVLIAHWPGRYSEDRFKSVFSQVPNCYFPLQYHYLGVFLSFKICGTLHRMWKTDISFLLINMSQAI